MIDKVEERPNLLAAILIALVLPCGTGHQFAGLTRRGIGWFAASAALFLGAASVVRSGGGLGVLPLVLFLAAIGAGWFGPVVDLGLIRPDRLKRVPIWTVAAFAVGSWIAGSGVRLGTRELVLEAFKIPSGAMFPSLHVQDNVFVDKAAYGPVIPFTSVRLSPNLPPAYGDIVVFEYPDPSPTAPRQHYIKRAVAFGGDTLEVDGGHPIIINGWRVPSCRVGNYELHEDGSVKRGELYVEFLGDHSYLTWFEEERAEGRQGPYRVKAGEMWVFGDNRNISFDSRAWFGGRGGGVPDGLIKGRAVSVWLAFEPNGGLAWRRLGLDLNGEPPLPPDADPSLAAELRRCLSERPAQTFPPRSP